MISIKGIKFIYKEMVLSNPPLTPQVEQVLLEHPAVAEAFVFGKPDDKWGEAVHAVCALKDGASLAPAELLRFLDTRIARYKKPQSLVFLPAPLQRNSKVST